MIEPPFWGGNEMMVEWSYLREAINPVQGSNPQNVHSIYYKTIEGLLIDSERSC